MSRRDISLLLDDALLALDKIERYVSDLDQYGFISDEKTVDAVVRNLEIIGEVVRQLPSDFKSKHSTIPWVQIAGIRNRIVHDYAGIDLEIIWFIIQETLPEFRKQINNIQ